MRKMQNHPSDEDQEAMWNHASSEYNFEGDAWDIVNDLSIGVPNPSPGDKRSDFETVLQAFKIVFKLGITKLRPEES